MQIEVRNGAFHYPNGKSVLQSVNFSFDGRGVFAVLGPNGAGKTTLLKCLLGLLPWSSGASFFNGRDRREWSTREFWRRTAYVPHTHFPAHALARAASGILVPQGKPPIFGTAAELFSEAKLSALFGIDVRIRTLDFDGRQTPVVAAVS